MPRRFTKLDRIAVRKGLTPITASGDQREIPDDFDGSPDELEELMGPSDEWFSPTAGEAAFLALADVIKSDRRAAKQLDAPDAVIEELLDLARLMTLAEKRRAKFRLEIG